MPREDNGDAAPIIVLLNLLADEIVEVLCERRHELGAGRDAVAIEPILERGHWRAFHFLLGCLVGLEGILCGAVAASVSVDTM